MDGNDVELVASMVEVLDQLGEDGGWDGAGVVLRADLDVVEVMPLAGRHPRELLLGHRADPQWRAMAVLSWGWAAPLGGGRPSAHPQRVRSRTAIAVARTGDIRTRCRMADGRVLHDVPEGNLVDCLLRTLDRPTAAPATGTEGLFATHWLGNLLVEVKRRRGLTWPEAAALHPALDLLAQGDMRVGPDALVPAAAALSRVCGWREIRRRCIEGGWLEAQVTPALAGWMDEGMLSRWLLESTMPVEALLADLAGLLVPAVARRVRRSLRDLGVGSAGADGDGPAGGAHAPLAVHRDDPVGDAAGLA
jgi:hypothetical protein